MRYARSFRFSRKMLLAARMWAIGPAGGIGAPNRVAILLGAVMLAGVTHGAYAQAEPVPAPSLGPQDVVRIQLEALRKNDEHDSGIGVAFRFASPANKRSTGPLPRFARMIRNGPYAVMLEFRSAAYEKVQVVDDRARQRVTLVGANGAFGFDFFLSRQREGDCQGCWMTDAVTVVAVSARPA
ncbi:MAG: DUF4864 domain-containing protein [Gammaproteobacteria bacterium]